MMEWTQDLQGAGELAPSLFGIAFLEVREAEVGVKDGRVFVDPNRMPVRIDRGARR